MVLLVLADFQCHSIIENHYIVKSHWVVCKYVMMYFNVIMHFADNPARLTNLIVSYHTVRLTESTGIYITILVHDNLSYYNIYIKYNTYTT